MRCYTSLLSVACGLVFLFSTHGAAAQDVSYPDAFNKPIGYFETALGEYDYGISSTVDSTRLYFSQGVQMMYAFTKEDAARSFREAWLRDEDCAICHWGEAWAWGPYLNGPMNATDAQRAVAAMAAAEERVGSASPRERALIEAMSVRYAIPYDRDEQARRDSAYAQAMQGVAAAYPTDLDIATLYAESLFLLEPRRGNRDLDDPDVQRLHAVLEDALRRDITHPGACHLYIHATESTTDPGKAEACSEHIAFAMPGASHINHMPSHTWNEIGRWGDAVDANIRAWHADQKAAYGEGFAIYPSHNLHMLLFAGSMDGQGGIATQAGRDYTTLTGNSMYEALTLIRFGRFSEVDRVPAPRRGGDVADGLWAFAQGYAALKLDKPKEAHRHLAWVQALADTSSARFRGHTAANLLGSAQHLLEGEMAWKKGNLEDAIGHFEMAAAHEDSLVYDEPEPLPYDARHWLGAALLAADRPADAERVYRTELEDHPRNGWSLFGLVRSLEAQGPSRAAELPALRTARDAAWARADIWLRATRF